jgi:hypothetical protein
MLGHTEICFCNDVSILSFHIAQMYYECIVSQPFSIRFREGDRRNSAALNARDHPVPSGLRAAPAYHHSHHRSTPIPALNQAIPDPRTRQPHRATHDKMAAASQKTKATITKVTLAHHAPYKNAKTSRWALCDKVIAKLPLKLREMIYEHIHNTDTETFRITGPCSRIAGPRTRITGPPTRIKGSRKVHRVGLTFDSSSWQLSVPWYHDPNMVGEGLAREALLMWYRRADFVISGITLEPFLTTHIWGSISPKDAIRHLTVQIYLPDHDNTTDQQRLAWISLLDQVTTPTVNINLVFQDAWLFDLGKAALLCVDAQRLAREHGRPLSEARREELVNQRNHEYFIYQERNKDAFLSFLGAIYPCLIKLVLSGHTVTLETTMQRPSWEYTVTKGVSTVGEVAQHFNTSLTRRLSRRPRSWRALM